MEAVAVKVNLGDVLPALVQFFQVLPSFLLYCHYYTMLNLICNREL